jgi:hypothetical protein
VGVKQVIDGDEVEARAEFEPEGRFRNGTEQQQEYDNAERGDAHRAVQPRGPPARRQQRFVEQQRRDERGQHRGVEPEPHGEHARPRGKRHRIQPRPDREPDSRQHENGKGDRGMDSRHRPDNGVSLQRGSLRRRHDLDSSGGDTVRRTATGNVPRSPSHIGRVRV